MGNVHASGTPPPPPQFLAPEPTPPPNFNEKSPSGAQKMESEASPYPGVMEDLHKRTKDVFPTTFEGIKLMINKGLSNHFQISHTIAMSSVTPSGYRFGATYVGTKQTGPNEAFPILLGDIDPSGNLNANIIHQFTERIRAKFGCQLAQVKSQQVSNYQLQTDYKGDKYSGSLTIANMNLFDESGLVIAHYLRSVTANVALGAEFALQYGPQVPGRQLALFSVAGRYNDQNTALSATVGTHVVHLCYYQKASEQLQIGCELETNLRMMESTASIGYQIDLPKIDVVFRGMVDSNWNVAAVLEKRLLPLPFTMSLSGVINHSKQSFRLGFGFVVG